MHSIVVVDRTKSFYVTIKTIWSTSQVHTVLEST